ncbi:MAG: uncharacterized protein KVP18_003959 [Porospora cf. gigantea A]|uniref:uncharacterized protein n=1 Tax=Porospora cf. gigantea A TaxID=2853593 RepID=UPI00355A0A5A|nr:MAG: hypothetical protein KVP18_003959 [Porospora cf. gigantea A]
MHILLVTVVGANSLVITCFNVLFMEGHWKGSFSEDSEGGMPSLLSMVTARTGSMRSPLYKAASEDGQSSMTKESRVQHDATPGNAIRLLQPAVSAPLGLQTAGDVFALDPILQILAFPLGQTSEGLTARQSGEEGLVGDVILHTPLHSYGLVNDRPTIIERMLFIPGTGTLLTYGVQERETCGEFSFEGVLQLWTFLEDVKPKAPRTIDLPFFVTSMIRNTFHPSSKWERTLLEQRLASTQRSDMVGSNEDTTSGESKAESLVDWYNPYPSGDPKDDSRWLVLLGTSEGDLRVFDAWSGSFTDFLITSQQVFSQITVPSLPEVMTTTDNPLVDVHVHPTSSQVVLLAYARGLVAEVHLVSTSVLDFYLPFSSRELKNVGDASVCQSEFRSFLDTETLCLPSATTSVGRLEVQAVHYQHRGRAILVSTVSANQTTEGLQPQLMVFARHKVNPILILDLDGLMGRSHSNCSLPFIHWHNKDLAPERQYDPSCIVKGSVYVLIRPRRLTAQERFHGQQLDADCPSNLIQFSGDCWTQVHGVFPSSKHQPDAVIQHCLTIPPHTIQAPYTCGFPTVASLGGLSLPPFRQDDSGDMVDLLRQSIAKLSRMLLSSCTILALTPFPFMQVLGTVVGIFNKKVDVMKGFYPQMSNWPAGFRSSRDDDVGDVECDEAGGCNAPKAFVSSWPAFSVSWSSMRMVGVSACDWYYRTVESKDSRFIKNRVVGFDKREMEVASSQTLSSIFHH